MLREAGRLAGREPILKRLDSLPNEARAMLVRPEHPHAPYEVQFQSGQERFLDHLVSHEVGHLLRLHRVPEDERLMPALTAETLRHAGAQILPEFAYLLEIGVPERVLPDLFESLVQDTAGQLASFPADLRIEAWLHRRYPGLRDIQRRSLLTEAERALPLFSPEAFAVTPPTLQRARMAMNAAQAQQISEFYDRPELLAPYERAGFAGLGRQLVRIALDPPDEGHRSDMRAINRWAEVLGLTGWFAWQRYRESR